MAKDKSIRTLSRIDGREELNSRGVAQLVEIGRLLDEFAWPRNEIGLPSRHSPDRHSAPSQASLALQETRIIWRRLQVETPINQQYQVIGGLVLRTPSLRSICWKNYDLGRERTILFSAVSGQPRPSRPRAHPACNGQGVLHRRNRCYRQAYLAVPLLGAYRPPNASNIWRTSLARRDSGC